MKPAQVHVDHQCPNHSISLVGGSVTTTHGALGKLHPLLYRKTSQLRHSRLHDGTNQFLPKGARQLSILDNKNDEGQTHTNKSCDGRYQMTQTVHNESDRDNDVGNTDGPPNSSEVLFQFPRLCLISEQNPGKGKEDLNKELHDSMTHFTISSSHVPKGCDPNVGMYEYLQGTSGISNQSPSSDLIRTASMKVGVSSE
jgi:hypothetical protein